VGSGPTCSDLPATCCEGVTRALRGCCEDVRRVLQGCQKGVSNE
jgi:hypothetical protein